MHWFRPYKTTVRQVASPFPSLPRYRGRHAPSPAARRAGPRFAARLSSPVARHWPANPAESSRYHCSSLLMCDRRDAPRRRWSCGTPAAPEASGTKASSRRAMNSPARRQRQLTKCAVHAACVTGPSCSVHVVVQRGAHQRAPERELCRAQVHTAS